MTLSFVPTKIFFTKGVGRHKEELSSFELALREGGIEKCNLVTVSSILPPNCKIIPREEGLKLLSPGQITFAVIARMATNEPHRQIAASIGMAKPADTNKYGYLSEHHAYGETEKKSGNYAEYLAASMLASTLGVEFDPATYDDVRKICKVINEIVSTGNTTQTAEGDKNGLWTTVFAAAVLLP